MSTNDSPVTCSRCETVPDPLPARGTLYFAPPISQTGAAILKALDRVGLAHEQPHANIFSTRFERAQLDELCTLHLGAMGELELHDTKSLILAEGESLEIHHLTRMQPLQSVVARVRGEQLIELLRNNGVYSHFHPIVHADDPASVFAYECLARARDAQGHPVMPGEMFSVARAADLMFNLDRACRLGAIRSCVEHGVTKTLFVNFNPATIYQPRFCLRTTLAAIEKAGLKPANLVFEVVESEEVEDVGHLVSILEYYRENGFGVALDDLGAGYASLNLLARLQPDYIKLDMELIRDVDHDPYKAAITRNLLAMARELGVKTIAEGVETVGEWRWLVDGGADFIQGFLFARPAAPPQEVTVPPY